MPITTPARTLVDLAPHIDDRELARSLRELLRLELAGPAAILIAARLRRGASRIRHAVGRHAGLPLDRARSDAEALALVRLHEAARPMPDVNRHIAGEEADLSWPDRRLIVELDGPQFHRDRREDARKQAIWRDAGWRVARLGTESVYERPAELLAVCPRS